MKPRRVAESLSVVMLASWALLSVPVPSASAVPCPDVEVIFARGTTEPPGVGGTGAAFVDSLRSQLRTRSIGVYAVDYPASMDFPTAVEGIGDAAAHARSMAATCPDTKLVLGGVSQGAAVIGFVTANVVPDGVPYSDIPEPMPPDVANHVAAVALFGKPNERFMRVIDEPPVAVGPLYQPKTIELCVPDDPVCSSGRDINAHFKYVEEGLVDQAAIFAVSRLETNDAQPSTPSSNQTLHLPWKQGLGT